MRMGIGCSVADRNRSLLITTKTWIVNPKIPGPCRRSAADLSSAADAPTYMSLGSHAKSGPRMRRSPRRATSYRRRNGSWLSPTDASEATAWRRGSTCLDLSLRGWNECYCGPQSIRSRIWSTPTRHTHQRRAARHIFGSTPGDRTITSQRFRNPDGPRPLSRWRATLEIRRLGQAQVDPNTPPCSHSLAIPHKFLGTLSVHELGRLCRYLPPTISRSVGRSADGERPWRQSSSNGSQYASLLPLASILARTR